MNLAQAITEQGLIGMPSTAPINIKMPTPDTWTTPASTPGVPRSDTLRAHVIRLIRAHGKPMCSAEIGEATGESRNTMGTTLTKMRRNGSVKVTGRRGSYLYGLPEWADV